MNDAPTREGRKPAAKTTTYGIVARDAPTVVLFRRGPTRHLRLLAWDLRDDTVRAGQWLVASIDPGPCGVSPNGELLVYEARKGGRTYTAISRPPYFTALAYWETVSPWTGGGFFVDDKTLVLGHKLANPYSAGTFPPGFEVTDVWTRFARPGRPASELSRTIGETPYANQGWTMTDRGPPRKPHPRRSEWSLERTRSGRHDRTYTVYEEPGRKRSYTLGVVDWADWAHDGTLLFGKQGGLYRQTLPRDLSNAPESTPVLVADLTGQVFEEIAPSEEALRWPGSWTKKRGRR